MANFVNFMDVIYPIGSIYITTNNISPADSIGGAWTKIKTFLYGADTAQETGGEATHALTVDEMPKYNHRTINQNYVFNAYDVSRVTVVTGTTATFSADYFTATDAGQHTITCRPTRPASSSTEQLKLFKGNLYIL